MGWKCKNCLYWNETEGRFGECGVLKSDLVINLLTGYEGASVQSVETEHDFGCNQFEDK